MPQFHIQTSRIQNNDLEGNSLFSSFSREHSHYEVHKTMLHQFAFVFKRCSSENATGMGLLNFHGIRGLTEADLFIPNNTEIRSLSCFGFACKDQSCVPEEAFPWDGALR